MKKIIFLIIICISIFNCNAQFVYSNTVNIATGDKAYISENTPSLNPSFSLNKDAFFIYTNVFSPYLLSELNSYLLSFGYSKKSKYVLSTSFLSRGMEKLRYYYFDIQYSQRILNNMWLGTRIYTSVQSYNNKPSMQLGFLLGLDCKISKKLQLQSLFINPHTYFYNSKIEQSSLVLSLRYKAVDNMFISTGLEFSHYFLFSPKLSLEFYFKKDIRTLLSYNLKSFSLGIVFPVKKICASFALSYNANLGPSASNSLFLYLNN